MSFRKHAQRELIKDFLLIVIGICVAFILSQIGFIDKLINSFDNIYVASFVAGIFFTSVFTAAPATVALIHISLINSSLSMALWGALGALCGDLVLFFLIRDHFADDLMNSLKPSLSRHILASFHLGFMKWLSPIIGAFVIVSPLPDEFALTLLGISKTHLLVLIPISFFMNLLSIYGLIWFFHLL